MAAAQQQILLREVAHRLFASEFNGSSVELKGDDERSPSYVVSPLGAKVNRLFVVGVLTECENIGQDGREMWRARVSDPTGMFTVYAGEYQPEASQVLSTLKPPCFIAVVGKARTYEPEPGQVYVSIRPETITVVDEDARDTWILQTAEMTNARLRAIAKVQAGARDVEALAGQGVPAAAAEGALLAKERYGDVDIGVYKNLLLETLAALARGETGAVSSTIAPPTPAARKADPRAADLAPPEDEALERLIVETVQKLLEEHPDGAPWDDIIDAGVKAKHDEDAVEETLNLLIDRGMLYEPILGKLKLA